MTDNNIKIFVIVNPNAAGGATMKRWPRLSDKMEAMIGGFEYDFTDAMGAATLLANEAVKDGYQRIIGVGGDGTLHEIIQGLFEKDELINPDVEIGILPFGSGADFAKTLKISNEEESALVRLRGSNSRKIDLGSVDFLSHHNKRERRYFINVADVGLGGEIVEKANNSPKLLGGFGTYLFSSVISFVSYKPRPVKVVMDNISISKKVTSVFIANGEYCGGGMWIAPRAEVDDGYFNVVVVGELKKWDLLSLAPRLYSGRLGSMPAVKYYTTKSLKIEADEPLLINLDGEQPGTTPAEFNILPKKIKFLS